MGQRAVPDLRRLPGGSEPTATILGAGQSADLVEQMLRTSGRSIDMPTPVRRREYALDDGYGDGSRVAAPRVPSEQERMGSVQHSGEPVKAPRKSRPATTS
jgi:hypothetical protein